jgi:hypothetical protein
MLRAYCVSAVLREGKSFVCVGRTTQRQASTQRQAQIVKATTHCIRYSITKLFSVSDVQLALTVKLPHNFQLWLLQPT